MKLLFNKEERQIIIKYYKNPKFTNKCFIISNYEIKKAMRQFERDFLLRFDFIKIFMDWLLKITKK